MKGQPIPLYACDSPTSADTKLTKNYNNHSEQLIFTTQNSHMANWQKQYKLTTPLTMTLRK
jgi:hypothetical protein